MLPAPAGFHPATTVAPAVIPVVAPPSTTTVTTPAKPVTTLPPYVSTVAPTRTQPQPHAQQEVLPPPKKATTTSQPIPPNAYVDPYGVANTPAQRLTTGTALPTPVAVVPSPFAAVTQALPKQEVLPPPPKKQPTPQQEAHQEPTPVEQEPLFESQSKQEVETSNLDLSNVER